MIAFVYRATRRFIVRMAAFPVAAMFALLSLVNGSASAQPSPTAIISRIRSTGNRPIDFHAAAFPDTVYVGEQITYQVAVLLSEQARSRLRRNPEFLPPELRGLLAYELGTPSRVPPRSYGGSPVYEAHVFQRALFAVAPGTMQVPSPQLTYSLPQSASYFSREERYVVRAESAKLVVKPIPTEGRPVDFTGAVGVLTASAQMDASSARIGDPLVLKVRIEGTGNVRLFPRPSVEISWASVVAGNERLQVDTTGARVRGYKEFEFLLTPTQDGPVTLPVIRYPYFDPYREVFATAETAPADVRVAAGALAAKDEDSSVEQLPLRPWRHAVDAGASNASQTVYWGAAAVVLLAPLPALLAVITRMRRRRSKSATSHASPLPRSVPTEDDSPAGTARRTRRVLLAALATRLQVTPAELVTKADVERVLRRRGVTRTTTAALLGFLDDLAAVGYGGADTSWASRAAVETRATQLLEAVDTEAVTHGRTRLWGRRVRSTGTITGLWVLLGGLGVLFALGPATARAQDDRGTTSNAAVACVSSAAGTDGGSAVAASRVTPSSLDLLVGEASAAYTARRYAAAAQRFASAVVACPRDVDLLLNWGTAAWAANDTVSAVIAWQRASRLEPLAADVQARVALLPAGARTGLAAVPMAPVTALAVAAVVLWVTAWALWWSSWRGAQRRTGLEVTGVVLLLTAVASAGAAWWGQHALDASGLAVVRRPETLRSAPGFESGTTGGVSTGDVVRMESGQEGWFRVALADGRDGWLPASRLAPLVAVPPTR